MKYFILLALMLSTGIQANEQRDLTCKKIESAARATMMARQEGTPMSKMMEGAGDNDLLRAIVVRAYKTNKFMTSAYKMEAVNDYGEELYLACYEAYPL